VWHEAPIPEGGWYLMGTARMGADPGRSVVNEWGRSRDVENLFIVRDDGLPAMPRSST
jgi:choline dehydrogenase-like flavoprotein